MTKIMSTLKLMSGLALTFLFCHTSCAGTACYLTDSQRKFTYKKMIEFETIEINLKELEKTPFKFEMSYKGVDKDAADWVGKCFPADTYLILESPGKSPIPIALVRTKKELIAKLLAMQPDTAITVYGNLRDVGAKIPKKSRTAAMPGIYVLVDDVMDGADEDAKSTDMEPKTKSHNANAVTSKFDPANYKTVKCDSLNLTRDTYINKKIKISIPYSGRSSKLDPRMSSLNLSDEDYFTLNTPSNANLDSFILVARRTDKTSVDTILELNDKESVLLFGELRDVNNESYVIIVDRIQKVASQKKEDSLEDLMEKIAK